MTAFGFVSGSFGPTTHDADVPRKRRCSTSWCQSLTMHHTNLAKQEGCLYMQMVQKKYWTVSSPFWKLLKDDSTKTLEIMITKTYNNINCSLFENSPNQSRHFELSLRIFQPSTTIAEAHQNKKQIVSIVGCHFRQNRRAWMHNISNEYSRWNYNVCKNREIHNEFIRAPVQILYIA